MSVEWQDVSRRTQILGWTLFTLSALTYIVDSLRSGDVISLVASLLFLLACGVFFAPLLRREAGR